MLGEVVKLLKFYVAHVINTLSISGLLSEIRKNSPNPTFDFFVRSWPDGQLTGLTLTDDCVYLSV